MGTDWQTLSEHGEPNEASQDPRVVVSARLDKPWMRWRYKQPEDRKVGDAGWECRSAGVGAQPCRRRQSCKDTRACTPKGFVLSPSCQHLSENRESATHAAYLEQPWQKEALVHHVSPGVRNLHLLVKAGQGEREYGTLQSVATVRDQTKLDPRPQLPCSGKGSSSEEEACRAYRSTGQDDRRRPELSYLPV